MTEQKKDRAAHAMALDPRNPEAISRIVANLLAGAARRQLTPVYWVIGSSAYATLRSLGWRLHPVITGPGFLTYSQAAKGVPASVVDAEGTVRTLHGHPVQVDGPEWRVELVSEGDRAKVGPLND